MLVSKLYDVNYVQLIQKIPKYKLYLFNQKNSIVKSQEILCHTYSGNLFALNLLFLRTSNELLRTSFK